MIADSSSLIIFAKINKLDIIIKLYGKIIITKGIYKETVEQELVIDASDAKIIDNLVNKKKIKVLSLDEKYEKFSKELRRIYPQLGIGESDAISLSLQEKNKSVIIDESIGRNIAKLYNLKPIGSLRILLEAYKRNIIDETELNDITSEMIKNKFRIGADVINEFWNIFEKLKKKKD